MLIGPDPNLRRRTKPAGHLHAGKRTGRCMVIIQTGRSGPDRAWIAHDLDEYFYDSRRRHGGNGFELELKGGSYIISHPSTSTATECGNRPYYVDAGGRIPESVLEDSGFLPLEFVFEVGLRLDRPWVHRRFALGFDLPRRQSELGLRLTDNSVVTLKVVETAPVHRRLIVTTELARATDRNKLVRPGLMTRLGFDPA